MSKSLVFIFILILTTCDNENEIQDYPDCMQGVIDNYLAEYPNPASHPASIGKYKYKNQEKRYPIFPWIMKLWVMCALRMP